MYFIYKYFTPVIALILLPVIIIALIIKPKFRAGFFRKLGFYKYKSNGESLTVFHAVSVGETNAVADTVRAYREKYPDRKIVITNTTKTGHEIAKKTLSSVADDITYFPFDFSFAVNSFFNAYKPDKIVIVETEIWPCFVKEAHKKGIEVYIANGRISPHSYEGYKKFSFVFKKILPLYKKILMQTKADAQRIKDIGAPDDKVEFMGNLKFDININLSADEQNALKERFKASDKEILIAASTHSGEDEIVIRTYKRLKEKFPELKLLIAPRHPQRFDKVYELINAENFSSGRVSENRTFDDADILLGDTMGELAKFFSFCKIAFIGGSFYGPGGHNPLEANIWNKPVVSGYNVANFKDIYKILTEKSAAIVAKDEQEFYEAISVLLSDKTKYEAMCIAAGQVFEENRGAVQYLINRLS